MRATGLSLNKVVVVVIIIIIIIIIKIEHTFQ